MRELIVLLSVVCFTFPFQFDKVNRNTASYNGSEFIRYRLVTCGLFCFVFTLSFDSVVERLRLLFVFFINSNGSIIVYFVLHFNVPVTTNEGIINLKIALKSGTIGPYKIRSLKTVEEFKAVPTTIPSAPTAVTSAAPVSPGERVDTNIPGELKKKHACWYSSHTCNSH